MKTRVVVIFPEMMEANTIADLRRRFDPLADLVPPHITLVFPFQSDLSKEDLESHIEACATDIAPFTIHLAQVTGHEGEYLFLNVKEGNDKLIALHDRLYQGLLQQFLSPQHTFIPHMTVGRLYDRASWQIAVEAVSKLEISQYMVVREISVYVVETDGHRRVESSISLTVREPLSFFDLAQSLRIDGPPDWSRNHDYYLYGKYWEQLEGKKENQKEQGEK